MFRSTCTVFGASSALAGAGRAGGGHPRRKPPSMSTSVSSAVVRSLVGRIIVSLLSLDHDHGVHLVGVKSAGDGVGSGGYGHRLAVLAGTGQPAPAGGGARPLAARGDEGRAGREGLHTGSHGSDVGV